MPRNSSGNYTLPSLINPVVPGTVIMASWANPTLTDVAQGVTDSLDRQGRGTMLAPLKLADGSAPAPAFAFGAESSTGLYRAGSGDMRIAVLGSDVLKIEPTGLTVTGKVKATPATAVDEMPTYGQLTAMEEDVALTLGKAFVTTAGFTLNTGLVNDGLYAICNNSAATIQLTQGSGLTLRLAGSTATGNRFLAPYGLAILWARTTTEYWLSGSGAL